MCMWKNRAGQSREETKVSDRFTSKDLSSCSPKPEGGEEGKTRPADNQLDILVLTSCLQSPKWFECCLPRRLLLPLMLLQQSQALQAFGLPSPGWAGERWYLHVFRETGMGLAAALDCAPSVLQLRESRDMPREPPLSSGFCCMRDPWTRFCKRRSGAFLLLLFILHLLLKQSLIAVFSLWYVTRVNSCAWGRMYFGRFCCSEDGERLGAGKLQHSTSTKPELLHKKDKCFP